MTITNNDDLIDLRDVEVEIDELEFDRDEMHYDIDEEHLAALQKLFVDASGYGDSLIRESYFPTYAREYFEETHDAGRDWPFNCIDWGQAAKELQVDYTAIDFEGVTYYAR